MRSKVYLATISLCIAAALYVLVGFVVLPVILHLGAKEDPRGADEIWGVTVVFGGFCSLLAALMLVVAYFIHRRQFWAWVAGLCIFGLFLPSLFLPLGALGLWGLLDRASREEFGVQVGRPDPR